MSPLHCALPLTPLAWDDEERERSGNTDRKATAHTSWVTDWSSTVATFMLFFRSKRPTAGMTSALFRPLGPGNCRLGSQINPNSWCYLALRQSHSAPSCHSLTALVSPLPFKATKVLVLFQTCSWHLMHDRSGAFCPVQRKTDTQFLIIVLMQLRVVGVSGPHQVTIGSHWFYSHPLTNCHMNYC